MSIQQRMLCDGCSKEISPWTALHNCSLGLLDHTRLDLCDDCRRRLTEVLGVKPAGSASICTDISFKASDEPSYTFRRHTPLPDTGDKS